MQMRPGQQPGIVADQVAQGRRFVAVGVILIAGSVPFLALAGMYLNKQLGAMVWVIVAAALLDLVLGLSFIIVGRKKMRSRPGWEQTPEGWGSG